MIAAALLAGLAVACLVGLPRPGAVRVRALTGRRSEGSLLSLRLTAPAAAVLGGGAGLLWVGPVPAGLLAVGGVLAARAVAERRRARDRARERVRAVEACATLAGELRAGRTAPEALAAAAQVAAGPSRDALAAAAAAARAGADVPAALLLQVQPAGATAVPEVLRGLAACWAVCASAGSGLAAAVDRLEEGLRVAQAQRRSVEAELAGPRATATMLALLPLAGLALAAGLGADPLHVLLHTPVGLCCLVAGVGLDLLGLRWTSRMVARAAEAV